MVNWKRAPESWQLQDCQAAAIGVRPQTPVPIPDEILPLAQVQLLAHGDTYSQLLVTQILSAHEVQSFYVHAVSQLSHDVTLAVDCFAHSSKVGMDRQKHF